MRVVCVGLATVDLVQRVARVPGVDEKAEALSAEVAAGGPATNAAVAAAALGAEVTLVTAVGAHPLGGLIRADLEACGVRLLDVTPHAAAPPPLSAVTVLEPTGQRTIVSRNAGDAAAAVPPDLGRILAAADAVLADGHHPALARAAARGARRLVLDAGSWRPVFADLLPRADVAACSATFHPPGTAPAKRPPAAPPPPGATTSPAAPDRPGTTAPQAAPGSARAGSVEAALRAAGVVRGAITHGPDPVCWWDGDAAGDLAVPPVAAVDTAGAGDVFHGALLVARACGRDLPAALRYAVAVAGIRVTHAGPRAWLADPRLPALRV